MYEIFKTLFWRYGPTPHFIVWVTLIVLGYDLWAYFFLPKGQTISEIITETSRTHLWIPFLWGALMLHWFARNF